MLIDPVSGIQYRLQLQYKHTETNGSVFDKLKAKLDAVASMSGMASVFALKGVVVCCVTDWECMEENIQPVTFETATSLEKLNEITQCISGCDQLSDLLDATLYQLEEQMGFANSMILFNNTDERSLYTVVSNGYEQQGAGAEVKVGEGIIGTVAEQGTPIKIVNMDREKIMTDAIRKRVSNDYSFEETISLPGLESPRCQLAVPIEAKNSLLGVLFVESKDDMNITTDTMEFMSSIANHLATAILLCDDDTCIGPVVSKDSDHEALKGAAAKLRYYPANKSIFIDNEYLIKGVAGAILWRLIQIYQEQGRLDFTNRELRHDSVLGLPEIVDNLEARLVLLKRRLDDKCNFIKMEKTGRGQFRLSFSRPLDTLLVPPS